MRHFGVNSNNPLEEINVGLKHVNISTQLYFLLKKMDPRGNLLPHIYHKQSVISV